ncbi:roadblock/LC7 domain-containing protein [Actinoplanes sp. NPDC051411]|uniref:roadblock/LC7 domain-containing protein n=1 Tax=Actinoplanes sp. NPDC051411 TaxID=3155522 RepID=UPI003445C3EE
MTVFTNPISVPQPSSEQRERLGFLLDRFCDSDRDIAHAIAISVDGIPMAASQHINPDVRDQLAAAAVGQMSLAQGMSELMSAGGVERVITNLGSGWVLVQKPHPHVVLIVLATHDADLALIDDQLMRLGEAIGPVLDPGARLPA